MFSIRMEQERETLGAFLIPIHNHTRVCNRGNLMPGGEQLNYLYLLNTPVNK